MLVITRKEGESLLIGDDIEINISKISDGSVKIGISAPKDKTILRKELVQQIKEENKIACNTDFSILKKLNK